MAVANSLTSLVNKIGLKEAENLTYNRATYVSLLAFAALGVIFYLHSLTLPPAVTEGVGPSYFPKIISVLLVVFCVISFFSTRKRNDEVLQMHNLRYVIITAVLTLLFIAVWAFVGGFYLVSFMLMFVLMYIYNQAKHSFRKLIVSFLIAFSLTAFVYVIFDRLLLITF